MPSTSKRQAHLMAACAHPNGRAWAKDNGVQCPPQNVAKDFQKADIQQKKGVRRMANGGPVAGKRRGARPAPNSAIMRGMADGGQVGVAAPTWQQEVDTWNSQVGNRPPEGYEVRNQIANLPRSQRGQAFAAAAKGGAFAGEDPHYTTNAIANLPRGERGAAFMGAFGKGGDATNPADAVTPGATAAPGTPQPTVLNPFEQQRQRQQQYSNNIATLGDALSTYRADPTAPGATSALGAATSGITSPGSGTGAPGSWSDATSGGMSYDPRNPGYADGGPATPHWWQSMQQHNRDLENAGTDQKRAPAPAQKTTPDATSGKSMREIMREIRREHPPAPTRQYEDLPGMANGSRIDMRHGGFVPPSPAGVDKVPAYLQGGPVNLDSDPRVGPEYVLPSDSVQAFPGGVRGLNEFKAATHNPATIEMRKQADGTYEHAGNAKHQGMAGGGVSYSPWHRIDDPEQIAKTRQDRRQRAVYGRTGADVPPVSNVEMANRKAPDTRVSAALGGANLPAGLPSRVRGATVDAVAGPRMMADTRLLPISGKIPTEKASQTSKNFERNLMAGEQEIRDSVAIRGSTNRGDAEGSVYDRWRRGFNAPEPTPQQMGVATPQERIVLDDAFAVTPGKDSPNYEGWRSSMMRRPEPTPAQMGVATPQERAALIERDKREQAQAILDPRDALSKLADLERLGISPADAERLGMDVPLPSDVPPEYRSAYAEEKIRQQPRVDITGANGAAGASDPYSQGRKARQGVKAALSMTPWAAPIVAGNAIMAGFKGASESPFVRGLVGAEPVAQQAPGAPTGEPQQRQIPGTQASPADPRTASTTAVAPRGWNDPADLSGRGMRPESRLGLGAGVAGQQMRGAMRGAPPAPSPANGGVLTITPETSLGSDVDYRRQLKAAGGRVLHDQNGNFIGYEMPTNVPVTGGDIARQVRRVREMGGNIPGQNAITDSAIQDARGAAQAHERMVQRQGVPNTLGAAQSVADMALLRAAREVPGASKVPSVAAARDRLTPRPAQPPSMEERKFQWDQDKFALGGIASRELKQFDAEMGLSKEQRDAMRKKDDQAMDFFMEMTKPQEYVGGSDMNATPLDKSTALWASSQTSALMRLRPDLLPPTIMGEVAKIAQRRLTPENALEQVAQGLGLSMEEARTDKAAQVAAQDIYNKSIAETNAAAESLLSVQFGR